MEYAIKLLQETANETYGEAISHLDHAIQTWYYLLEYNDIELRVAGFWHDIGHSIAGTKRMMKNDIDLGAINHEELGSELLQNVFNKRICELIRQHTNAKRYMPDSNLSNASQGTLEYQGGEMDEYEKREFEANPLFDDIIKLRRADNLAKNVNFLGNKTLYLLRAIDESYTCSLISSMVF